jgi:DNA repair protein RadC
MIGDFVDKSDVIGIDFMDYVIIGSGAYMSAREEGCM